MVTNTNIRLVTGYLPCFLFRIRMNIIIRDHDACNSAEISAIGFSGKRVPTEL